METEGVREFFEIAIPELLGASDSDENAVPVEFRLLQNYPNPFNSTTTIRYELPVHGQVSLQLYNILGQQITTLFEGHRQAGFHSVSLTVSDLSSGLYFVKLNAGGQVFTRKVMLIK
ncbi:MAG: T9SS type A sorting domain-containing protein [Calditrichaeota bacterium]|nr:T9SS type A sorting domain-containing protein [Calditrichota bacterium]